MAEICKTGYLTYFMVLETICHILEVWVYVNTTENICYELTGNACGDNYYYGTKKMGLLDWSTSSYGRGMQWKETGIWTARKPQGICMKLITRNIMQTLHGIALLSHQITT